MVESLLRCVVTCPDKACGLSMPDEWGGRVCTLMVEIEAPKLHVRLEQLEGLASMYKHLWKHSRCVPQQTEMHAAELWTSQSARKSHRLSSVFMRIFRVRESVEWKGLTKPCQDTCSRRYLYWLTSTPTRLSTVRTRNYYGKLSDDQWWPLLSTIST